MAWMRMVGLFTLIAILGSGAPAEIVRAAGDDPPLPEPRQVRIDDLPWTIRLGLRVLETEHAFPLIDRVVLVPDEATFVDELLKWSDDGRWPVLIEDDHLAPMFIRRFKPAQVIRRASVGDWPEGRNERTRRIESALIAIWGGDPERETILDVFRRRNHRPPGAVVISAMDTAWPAALALAAGRGQPLLWLEGAHGTPDAVTSQDRAEEIRASIEAMLDLQGYPWRSVGEGIDAITICRRIAGRVNLPRFDSGEREPAALTDYLGRDDDGERYAVVGWIFGDEVRTTYIAMCSLFLPRKSVWLVNTYPAGGNWESFAMDRAITMFAARGYEIEHTTGREASEGAWVCRLAGGVEHDAIVMNSKGNVHFFDMSTGRLSPLDVPVLNVPAAVHFTHSWSFRSPENPHTVGGKWLERGAYAYVGSMHEPYLAAFVPPTSLAERWANFVPLLVGARHMDGPAPFATPWKVSTFGDPLMPLGPPDQVTRARTQRDAAYGEDVFERARALMRAASDDESGESIAEAIRLLDLLGRDEIALQLWRHARQRGHEAAAAKAALGPLFRAKDADGFLAAWRHVNEPNNFERTMLWHLITPRLSTIRDEETLRLLERSIRRPLAHVDIERLAPRLARVISRMHVRRLIEQELEQTMPAYARQHLERLREAY